ncbi:hypothetical protein E8E13_007336 [Curvularia kusanoi]|uniref:Uncharacterized protein n=1 Tax=Curvularia kusanoi TaxID=90978 RepID=A0A9P4WDX0_CURKU|nr:hypothetical protein E8E13_007336 [Curvularia kusanoi]
MILLDLPPELFKYIVTYLVTKVGVRQAWKSRQVCRTFKEYIDFEIFANQPIRAFLKPGALNARTILRENQGLYLSYHTWVEKGAHTFLPRYMKGTCEEVCKGLKITEHEKWKYTRLLCDQLVKKLGHDKFYKKPERDVRRLIEFNDTTKSIQSSVDDARREFFNDMFMTRVAAAAAFGNLHALRIAIMGEACMVWGDSKLFGYPLALAAAGGHIHIVSTILKYFEQKPKACFDVDSIQFHIAIEESLQNHHLDIALLLLQFNHAYGHSIREATLNIWTRLAMDTADLRVIQQIRKVRVDCAGVAFKALCASGDLAAVRMFVEEGLVSLKCVSGCDENFTPIQQAASRRGARDVVKLLLDMGSDPDAGNYFGGAGNYFGGAVCALELSVINNDYDTVHVLLEYGANPENVLRRWERRDYRDDREAIKGLLLEARDRQEYFVRPKGPRTDLTIDAEDLIEKEQTFEVSGGALGGLNSNQTRNGAAGA